MLFRSGVGVVIGWEKWATYAQTQISLALDCADNSEEADGLLAYAAESIERARNELQEEA